MSEYIRMVSYFYRYQNGGKQENVGFGKVEGHNGKCRITLKLNDTRGVLGQSGEVYFYRYKQGDMYLYPLGEAAFNNNMLQFRDEFLEEAYTQDGHDLKELSGLLVYYNEQLFYGSQWSEEPIYVGDLVRARTALLNERKADSFKLREAQEVDIPEQKEYTEKQKEKKMEIKPESSEGSSREEMLKAAGEGEGTEIREQERVAASAVREETSKKLTGIPYLLKHRSPLPAFANNEVMQCVRIMPEDIGLMARSNWEYGNNSFLMHGFYNYHYLLLGSMVYEDGARQYVLGVPGIYSGKDQYLAQIFGFRRFVPLRTCPFKTREFGYWIAKLSK